jgi:predicted metal-dependent hydrolase
MQPDLRFCQAISQFNQQQFYACHDTLEAIWSEAREPAKTFYQGILQIAVGCYHLGNNNWRGAVILLGEGRRKLLDYEPEYQEINVTKLVESTTNLLSYLQEIPPEKIATFKQKLNEENTTVALHYPQIIKS